MNLTQFRARRRARREYFAAQNLAASFSADLYTTTDPGRRTELLDRFADMEQAMARVHRDAFGPAPMEDEGGRDLAESLALSADLTQMLADTERALDEGLPNRRVFEREGSTTAEVDSWMLLCQTRDRSDRAALIDLLYGQCRRRVGGQAAESLACHADTERELVAAHAESRRPKPPKAMPSRRAIAAIFIVVIGMALFASGLFPHWGMR